MPTRRWRRWQLIAGIWLLPGLYFAVQVYLQRSYENQPITIGAAFQRGLVFWLLWVFSSPLIARLARAYPFGRDHWTDGLLLHLPAGTIFSLAHLLLYVLITSWLDGHVPGDVDQLLAQFQPVFLSSFAWWSLVYWTILIASYAFDLYERYQDGLLRASQLEAQLAQAELQALNMQLHTHFLFNTLNSIMALIPEDPKAAERVTERLAALLRYSNHSTAHNTVPLEQEVKVTTDYLEIEKTRFGDRLSYSIDVSDHLMRAQVPPFSLQTLVENSVKYGGGEIRVSAQNGNGRFLLRVWDSGDGFPRKAKLPEGHGLRNLEERLDALWGSNATVEFPREDAGTTVQISIPTTQ